MSKKQGTGKQNVPKPGAKQGKDEKSNSSVGVKKSNKIFNLYNLEGDKITRLRPVCERCGPGYFMANHNDRYTCGHCGFTRYKRA